MSASFTLQHQRAVNGRFDDFNFLGLPDPANRFDVNKPHHQGCCAPEAIAANFASNLNPPEGKTIVVLAIGQTFLHFSLKVNAAFWATKPTVAAAFFRKSF